MSGCPGLPHLQLRGVLWITQRFQKGLGWVTVESLNSPHRSCPNPPAAEALPSGLAAPLRGWKSPSLPHVSHVLVNLRGAPPHPGRMGAQEAAQAVAAARVLPRAGTVWGDEAFRHPSGQPGLTAGCGAQSLSLALLVCGPLGAAALGFPPETQGLLSTCRRPVSSPLLWRDCGSRLFSFSAPARCPHPGSWL